MPGMMDTVLNLGLNDETVEGLAKLRATAALPMTAIRRFIQMYSDVVLGVPHHVSRRFWRLSRKSATTLDTEITADQWEEVIVRTRPHVKRNWTSVPAGSARPALGRDRGGVRLVDE
jgi:pyruvate,orthophosphate dikinase